MTTFHQIERAGMSRTFLPGKVEDLGWEDLSPPYPGAKPWQWFQEACPDFLGKASSSCHFPRPPSHRRHAFLLQPGHLLPELGFQNPFPRQCPAEEENPSGKSVSSFITLSQVSFWKVKMMSCFCILLICAVNPVLCSKWLSPESKPKISVW